MPVSRLLIPVKKCRRSSGAFLWPAEAVLGSADAADALPLGQLAADLPRRCGVKARVDIGSPRRPAVRIARDHAIASPEGYRLAVSPAGVEISVSADAGAYYAVQTLRELLAVHGRRIPACAIDDQPDFARRGLYHDCSRGKVPKLETLKALVERLGRWKINELQLYVENVFTFRRHPAIGRRYDPFTPEEILRLQEHCKRHHVRLVGSLASFGHMERILALPDYRHLGEMPGFGGWPGGTTLCPEDPGSIRLVEDLFDEFVPLFEASDFNVCCDETKELGRGRSRQTARRIGVGRLYLQFLEKLHRLMEKHGKRMNLWADIALNHPELLSQLPRDVVLGNWDYEPYGRRIARTKEIARAGLSFMVCPSTNAWLTHGTRLPRAVRNVSRFAAEGRKWAAEGLLNTDWGDSGHRNFLGVSLHGIAHGAAHAWNGAAVDDKNFTQRFCLHVFGQRDERLANALRLLGGAYLTCRARSPAMYHLFRRFAGTRLTRRARIVSMYRALVEPLAAPKDPNRSSIHTSSRLGLEKVLAQLADPGLWPESLAQDDAFEDLAIHEIVLAARMDRLACERALAAKALRSGRDVPGRRLARLAEEMERLAGDFSALWLARNKPSRLKYNLLLFRRVQREAERLARRAGVNGSPRPAETPGTTPPRQGPTTGRPRSG